MTLTDTGPLVALLDSREKHHTACVNALKNLAQPLVTTWPCVTEAMYLLGKARGHAGQDALWSMIDNGLVTLHELSPAEIARMRVLMAKYHDTPMDLADASLVVAAETLRAKRIFTVDTDFYVYVLADGSSLPLVP